MAARRARLTNSHGQALSIAEYVVTEVLVHYQHRAERVRAQAEHRWQPVPFRELGLTHWLIVGFGAIGQAVAQRVRPFGATVTAVDQVARPLADRTFPLSAVRDLAPEADVVMLALPLTDETAGVADARLFGAMKSDAVFVNVGRGGLVDEAALLAALDAGAPAHAVLDVVVTEPLPGDSPLWDHPRVVLSAHTAALGSGHQARNDAAFLANLARFVAGQALESEVDHKTLASPVVDWKER
jgi:phosphoglycerate dehydrogenase-like enzyme